MDGQELSRCDEKNLRVDKGAKKHLMGRNERGERRVGGLKSNPPYRNVISRDGGEKARIPGNVIYRLRYNPRIGDIRI
jgi:hypothetical protein